MDNLLQTIHTIESLEDMLEELYEELQEEFPQDSYCEQCGACFCEEELDEIYIPDWVKEMAGLDVNTPLCVVIDKADGSISLEPAIDTREEYAFFSDRTRLKLRELNVCSSAVEEKIMDELEAIGL